MLETAHVIVKNRVKTGFKDVSIETSGHNSRRN